MSISDLRCDQCGRSLVGLGNGDADDDWLGVRFVYHPGDAKLRDDSGLLCRRCWAETSEWLGEPRLGPGPCPRCDTPAAGAARLHVSCPGDLESWQLCRRHAVEFLNRLRTVDPKLDAATFVLPTPVDEAEEQA